MTMDDHEGATVIMHTSACTYWIDSSIKNTGEDEKIATSKLGAERRWRVQENA